MNSGEEFKVVKRDLDLLAYVNKRSRARTHLLVRDAQLLQKFSLSSVLDTRDSAFQIKSELTRNGQRVGAACVGPHVGESDLFVGTLLQQQLVLVVEKENRKGTVEQSLINVGHDVAWHVRFVSLSESLKATYRSSCWRCQ